MVTDVGMVARTFLGGSEVVVARVCDWLGWLAEWCWDRAGCVVDGYSAASARPAEGLWAVVFFFFLVDYSSSALLLFPRFTATTEESPLGRG